MLRGPFLGTALLVLTAACLSSVTHAYLDSGSYYLSMDNCYDVHCKYCLDGYGAKCYECNNRYFLKDGYCSDAFCNVDKCQTCHDNDRSVCAYCLPGYRLVKNAKACQPCGIDNCGRCDTSPSEGTARWCDSCKPGYEPRRLTDDKGELIGRDRTFCDPACAVVGCSRCSPDSLQKCQVCRNNFVYRPSTGKCDGCAVSNCDDCGEADKVGDGAICRRCAAGFTLTDNVCQPVAPVNSSSSSSGNHRQPSGGGNTNTGGTAGGDGSNGGGGSTNDCTGCPSGYTPRCRLVNAGILPPPGKSDPRCIPCGVANCEGCTAPGVCGLCASGYHVNSATSTCVRNVLPCAVTYCNECQPGSATLCKRCIHGWGVTTSSTCVRALSNGATERATEWRGVASVVVAAAIAVASL